MTSKPLAEVRRLVDFLPPNNVKNHPSARSLMN